MAGLKVYYDLMSQPSRAVVLFLKVNNIPFIDCAVALRKGEHLQPAFTKINPVQRVPVIDDNGFVLTESVAILKYLISKYNLPSHWYPKEVRQRARIEEYVSWQHSNTRLFGSMYFRVKVLYPRQTGEPHDPEKLEQFRQQLDTTCDHLENIYLKETPYIHSPDISIADLLCICELGQPIAAGYNVLENRPVLSAWHGRVKERLQPHFDPVFKMVYKVQEVFGSQPKL